MITRGAAVVALVASTISLYLAFGGTFAPFAAIGTSPFALLAMLAVMMIATANVRHALRLRATRLA
ncbi:MAG: hypothetical protein ACKO3W_02400, partial [bacterium]